MLDLNLNADSTQSHDDSVMLLDKFPEASSGTSNSSVVNAEGSSNEDSCSTRAGDVFTFNFGILKVEGAGDVVVTATKELFPVSAENWQGQSSTSSVEARKSSMDLSLDRQNGEVKVVQVQQQQPQVKKSRRGPRSRSSQYRGVTFYRRTGRWESHIWFVHFSLFILAYFLYIDYYFPFFFRFSFEVTIIICFGNLIRLIMMEFENTTELTLIGFLFGVGIAGNKSIWVWICIYD